MIPCPFPASSFRQFKEFVPYALRHNQNVQIPLLKKSLACNFFLRKAFSLWNSNTENKIFSQPLHESFKFPLSDKKTNHHLLGLNPNMTSIRCMLRFAHSPLNITKTTIVFVYVVKWRPNYTYSSIVTFTAQHEQPFIIKFRIF